MRVITGKAKGRKLSVPSGMDIRPTLDRVKESLFSILMPYIADASVLDLFAGSGALGIEALSRGARMCVFVDCAKRSYDCVLRNLKTVNLAESAKVFLSDWERFLKRNTEKFDLIFLDPPYSRGIENAVFPYLLSCLSEHGIVVLETEYEVSSVVNFSIIRAACYGRVYITLLKKDDCQ